MVGESKTLDIRLGSQVSIEDCAILSIIINSAWSYQKTTQKTIRERLRTDQLFVISYDIPTNTDIEYFSNFGVAIPNDKHIPTSILETISIETHGVYDNVPKNYNELTKLGRWRNICDRDDTLIMVDITTLFTRRGRNGKGEAKSIINFAKKLLPTTNYLFVLTYTPNIENIKLWHINLGAEDTRYLIPDARPEWEVTDVNLMSYSHLL